MSSTWITRTSRFGAPAVSRHVCASTGSSTPAEGEMCWAASASGAFTRSTARAA
ncbi:hypothetical protein SMICM17S_07750 [Streptomyces microflavus]